MLAEFIATTLGTFVSLLPIANPFSTAVVFLALTQHLSEARAHQQARMACVYMAAVLLTSLFAGAVIMAFFGISIPALRVAGGLIVARIGFGMLNPEPEDDLGKAEHEDARRMTDLAFTPLAMPMLSGPGSIAVTIGMTAGAESLLDYLAIAGGIVLVAYAAWLVLSHSRAIITKLGPTGVTALVRIMGFLLVCVGVQFIGLGLVEVASTPAVLEAILEALEQARN
jgi:multiple antibiotic resistance protein